MAELHLLSPEGFGAAGVYAGIKSRQTPDVGLLVCDTLATAAAAFTTNRVVSPGVTVGREHVRRGRLRGFVVNAGNANACTGKRGLRDTRRMCEVAADVTGAEPAQFLPSSTGIIGHFLPMDKVERGIRDAAGNLGNSPDHALQFADAIQTTDTRRKVAAARFKLGRTRVTLAGVCKGSGMIGPRLNVGAKGLRSLAGRQATMLAYLTTDARVSAATLRSLLQRAVEGSFNSVTVDDHASTNDTAAILASGASGAGVPPSGGAFYDALLEVCQSLAYQIAADGEGATKVVAITIKGVRSESDARTIARTIANSPLVKTAMHGNDPNWGRIVSAAGYAGVPFEADRCRLRLQGTTVFRNGQPAAFDAAKVSHSLQAPEVRVELDCRAGNSAATVWTCDLSREYITINADYHT